MKNKIKEDNMAMYALRESTTVCDTNKRVQEATLLLSRVSFLFVR